MSQAQHRRSSIARPALMIGGTVLLLIAAGAVWLHGGRVVSVDDALIGAARLPLSNDISGTVASVAVHEGQSVHRGDVLLSLDDRPFRIALDAALAERAQTLLEIAAMKRDYARVSHQIAEAQTQLASDEASVARLSPLVGSGGVTRAEYDDARFRRDGEREAVAALGALEDAQLARLDGNPDIAPEQTPQWQQAQARVAEAERELSHIDLRAPFDGIVTQVDTVQPGLYLAAGTPAMALVSQTDIWAEGHPKETELTYLHPGDKVEIHVDSYPGEAWQGEVESIAPATGGSFSVLPAQNTSGNWVKVVQRVPVRVRILPHDSASPLRLGMSVVLDIDTGHARHLGDLF